MKVAIVGSRDYANVAAVRAYIRALPPGTVVVSGGASGVDTVAFQEARRCKMGTQVFDADWAQYGKRAGALRNQKIVDAADRVVAFWDGVSKGTKITIDMAKRAGKPLEVITPMTPPPNNDEERVSRNLCKTYCYFCLGKVVLTGPVAPITPDHCGVYFKEYEGMLVADAECVDCEAKYLAWVDETPRKRNPWRSPYNDGDGLFSDLSFRSTFNDEPGEADLPKYNIKETVIRERTGPYDGPYAAIGVSKG